MRTLWFHIPVPKKRGVGVTHFQGGNTEAEEEQARPEGAARAPDPDGPAWRTAFQNRFRAVVHRAWRMVGPRHGRGRGAGGPAPASQAMAALNRGASSLAGAQTMSECLDGLVQELLKLPGVDCCGVLLPDSGARVLRLAGHQGIGSVLALEYAVLPLDGDFGARMLAGSPSWHHDIGTCRSRGGAGGESLRSVLVLPVRLQGGLVAAVAIGSHAAGRLPEVSCHAAAVLALQAGASLHRLKCREALAAGEARLRVLLEHSIAAVAIVDAAGSFIQVNRKFEQLTGIGMDEVRGRRVCLCEIIDRTELGGLEGWIHARIFSLEETGHFECELRTRAGPRVQVELEAGRILWNEEPCLFLSASASPAAPDRRMPAPEDAGPQAVQAFLQACDRERGQLGRNLHDLLGSQLVGLAYLADGLVRRLRREAPGQVDAARQLRDEIMLAHQQLRRIVLALSPPDGAEETLAAGLQRLGDNVRLLPGTACRLENLAGDLTFDHEATNHLLCLAREAVVNALRHGQARSIVLTLDCRDGQGLLVIDDDGCGLAENDRRKESSGLHIMRYRAAALGGALVVHARPTGGVSVRCTFDGNRYAKNNAGNK